LPESSDGQLLYRYFPTVGNGHIATVVYTDTIFMNGLYSGFKGESHRARIPTRNNVRLVDVNGLRTKFLNSSFLLDVTKGIFIEKFTIEDFCIEIKLFAHQYYHKVMVNQIHAVPIKPEPSPLQLKVIHDTGPSSQDIAFEEEAVFESPIASKFQCGKVTQVEDPFYQPNSPTACVIFMELPEILEIKSEIIHTFIASYDTNLDGASRDFSAVVSLVSEKQDMRILESHVNAWSKVWNDGNIIIEGNLELAKVVHGCLYYLISSLPITANTYSNVSQFYGLSPGGLANGAYLLDYQGHTFWDMEIWMFPPILYLYTDMAREILNYRLRLLQPARKNAQDTGFHGARYPWEGGVTGRDVTPECCPENFLLQVHLTADIAFAVRQYIQLTRDSNWLKVQNPNYPTNGCGFIRELAEFLLSRITYDPVIRQHEINEVIGPNDEAKFVNNNGFTNVAAAYSIFFAKYAKCLCGGSMEEVPEEWVNIAKNLKLVYDPNLDYHPNFEGYRQDERIKQADSVLLGFPLMYAMNATTRRNDLNIYEKATRKTGPGMTWSMHTIGVLELDEVQRADKLFERSYKSYVRQPFKIWTATEPPKLGAVNYLTGMGGFLQSIISGYAGFRLFPEKILFYKPRLPPNTTKLQLTGS
ncbi:Acid trehalase-like protein 1, partial [Orchesella cincta]